MGDLPSTIYCNRRPLHNQMLWTIMEEKKETTLKTIIFNNFFIIRIIWKLSKIRFLIKSVMTLFSAVFPVVNILLMRYIIFLMENRNELSLDGANTIYAVIIALVAMQVLPRLLAIWNGSLIEPLLAARINNYINEVFIDKSKIFAYKDFENPKFYDKYTRSLSQAETLPHAVFNSFFQLLSCIINLLLLATVIVSLDPIVLIFIVIGAVLNLIQSTVSGKLGFNTKQKLTPFSRQQSYIKRILFNPEWAKDIKCNDIISTGKKYYVSAVKGIIEILKKYGIIIALINTVVILLSSISTTVVFIILFTNIWKGIYTIADFSALTSSTNQFEAALNSFFNSLVAFYNNSLEIDNFKFVYLYENDSEEGFHVYNPNIPTKIEFKNVSFKYPGSKLYALKNVSLTINPGEKVSLVGLNGCGKSTLVKLIMGLYEATEGEIFINDINILDYKRDTIQMGVGAVFQEHTVYAFDVKENIAFEGVISKQALHTLEELNIYNKLESLPKGFSTHLSKEFDAEGTNLSGGEIQKICISRALNKTSGLYIFDEPTSALDPLSEYSTNTVMIDSSHQTTIIVSHRLSTTVMVNRVLFFENGMLTEQGSHEDLLRLNGKYAKLFYVQAKNYK